MQSATPVIVGLEPYELKIGGPEAGQPQFRTLFALRSPLGRVMGRWEFTAEERQEIADGADVFLSLDTNGQPYPPTMVMVMKSTASADYWKHNLSLDDELALRMMHDDLRVTLAAFEEKKKAFEEKCKELSERAQQHSAR